MNDKSLGRLVHVRNTHGMFIAELLYSVMLFSVFDFLVVLTSYIMCGMTYLNYAFVAPVVEHRQPTSCLHCMWS